MSNTWKDRRDIEHKFAALGVGAFKRRERAEDLAAFYAGEYGKVKDMATATEDAFAFAQIEPEGRR